MKRELLQPLAEALRDQLRRACVRIEIAGSLRRGTPDPHDIELVCIPAIGAYTVPVYDLFMAPAATVHRVNQLDEALTTLRAGGAWDFDPVLKRNGPRYKRLRYTPPADAAAGGAAAVCCDLFITDRRRWGLILAIRTGPADFSQALVAYARRQMMFVEDGLLHGHAPTGYDQDGRAVPCPAGERCGRIRETPEERDVFTALGLPWIAPAQRTAAGLATFTPRGWQA